MSTITGTFSNEKGMTVFIKRHPILSVYLIMFVVAWSVMIPQSLYSQGLIDAPLPEFLEVLTGWFNFIAFALGAVILLLLSRGTLGYEQDRS
jgi:hypothetical protein